MGSRDIPSPSGGRLGWGSVPPHTPTRHSCEVPSPSGGRLGWGSVPPHTPTRHSCEVPSPSGGRLGWGSVPPHTPIRHSCEVPSPSGGRLGWGSVPPHTHPDTTTFPRIPHPCYPPPMTTTTRRPAPSTPLDARAQRRPHTQATGIVSTPPAILPFDLYLQRVKPATISNPRQGPRSYIV